MGKPDLRCVFDCAHNSANKMYDYGSVINDSVDMNLKEGYAGTMVMKFSKTVYAALTEEQKTIFANKKWTVASA